MISMLFLSAYVLEKNLEKVFMKKNLLMRNLV